MIILSTCPKLWIRLWRTQDNVFAYASLTVGAVVQPHDVRRSVASFLDKAGLYIPRPDILNVMAMA